MRKFRKELKLPRSCFLKKEDVTFELVDDFDDTTIRGLSNFSLLQKKMLSVENIFDFSAFEDLSPKENFIKSTITKQYQLSRLLFLTYPDYSMLRKCFMLMGAI